MLAFTATAALALTACSSGAATDTEAPAEGGAADSVKIGLISSANNYWGGCMQGGVEAAATENSVELLVANSDGDAAKELSNVEDMISRGVDAILLNTVSVDALQGGIQKAQSANIPMYMIAVVPQNLDDVLGATIVDLNGVGGMAAGWITEDAAGADATAALVVGAPGAASDMLAAGFEKALPGSISVVANQPGMYNRAKAMEVTENIIEANPDLDYLFVLNEDMAAGARAAFDGAGAQNVKIVTMNGTEDGIAAIEAGSFSATISDSAAMLGATSLENALALLNGDSDQKVSAMDVKLITEANLDEAIPFCSL